MSLKIGLLLRQQLEDLQFSAEPEIKFQVHWGVHSVFQAVCDRPVGHQLLRAVREVGESGAQEAALWSLETKG